MASKAILFSKLLNTALQADPASSEKCIALEGKSFALHFKDLKFALCFRVKHHKLAVEIGQNLTADATLSGATIGLIKTAFSKNSQLALFENHLEIQGNLGVAERFQALFKQLDIDWEEALSQCVGDAPAFYMGEAFRKTKRWLRGMVHQAQHDTQDYLTEEAQYLPTKSEVEAFYGEIYALSADVERLSARIHNLRTHNLSKPSHLS